MPQTHRKGGPTGRSTDSSQHITVREAADLTDQLKILPLINTLIDKQVIILEEELKDHYKPRKEDYVILAEAFHDEDAMQRAI